MADQTGKWINVGGRMTYHPPFVNQLFDPPFDQCSVASAVNLINVSYLGQIPATHAEVKQLRQEINDREPNEGWHTDHNIRMIRSRYNLRIKEEDVDQNRMRERLQHGWAVSVGINLNRFSNSYTPWDNPANGTSVGGHRVVLLGWDGAGKTKVLDPMFSQGKGYRGKLVPLADIWHAMTPGRSDWRRQQLWAREGERVITTLQINASFTEHRTVTLAGSNVKHKLYDLEHQDGQPIKTVSKASPITRTFDLIGTISQQPNTCWKPEGETFIRLRGTNVDKLWLDASLGNVTADLSLPACAIDNCQEQYEAGEVQGSADEEKLWTGWVANAPIEITANPVEQMTDDGGGRDEDGIGIQESSVLATSEPEDVEPTQVPDEVIV